MRKNSSQSWLVVIMIILVACQAEQPIQVTPSKVNSNLEIPTSTTGEQEPVVLHVQSSTPTTRHSPTPTDQPPTATFTPSPTLLTATATPIYEPIAYIPAGAPTGWMGVSMPLLSRTGQLALIINGVLLVETGPGSDQYKIVDQGVGNPAWSPNGEWLAYAVYSDTSLKPGEFRLWSKKYDQVITLKRQPKKQWEGSNKIEFQWAPDSSQILFEFISGSQIVPVVMDLKSENFMELKERRLNEKLVAVNSKAIFVYDDCGYMCLTLGAIDYKGKELWDNEGLYPGVFVLAPDNKSLLYLYDWYQMDESFQGQRRVFTEIQLESGAKKNFYVPDTAEVVYYISEIFPPLLSRDGGMLIYYLTDDPWLLVMKRSGEQVEGIYQGVVALDVRAGGGILGVDLGSESGEYGLVFIDPLQKLNVREKLPAGAQVVQASWSPDGKYAAVSYLVDNTQSGLAVWRPSESSPKEMIRLAGNATLGCLSWAKDGRRLYFNAADYKPYLPVEQNGEQPSYHPNPCQTGSTMWQVNLDQGELRLVADRRRSINPSLAPPTPTPASKRDK